MSMIKITQKGDFSKTYRFLNRIRKRKTRNKFNEFGQMGVDALRQATPKDTGKTADSWSYEVIVTSKYAEIIWSNSNFNKYFNIAVGIQYGHATRNGGYVKGIDYINPAMKPVFDSIANEMWKEVTTD